MFNRTKNEQFFIVKIPIFYNFASKTIKTYIMIKTNNSLFRIIILICAIVSLTSIKAEEQSKTFSVLLYRCSLEETEHRINPGKEWHRSISKPVVCEISECGLSITSIDVSSIIKYEVYDDAGGHLMSFGNQSDFIDFVYHAEDSIIICFILEDYALIGLVDIR